MVCDNRQHLHPETVRYMRKECVGHEQSIGWFPDCSFDQSGFGGAMRCGTIVGSLSCLNKNLATQFPGKRII